MNMYAQYLLPIALLKAEIQTHSNTKVFLRHALSDVLNTRSPKISQMLLKILHLQKSMQI